MSEEVSDYAKRRDLVCDRLGEVSELARPGGAFYAYPKIPDRLGMTASEFMERCIERSVIVIPGKIFSGADTHIRISYATDPVKLARGLDVITDLMRG